MVESLLCFVANLLDLYSLRSNTWMGKSIPLFLNTIQAQYKYNWHRTLLSATSNSCLVIPEVSTLVPVLKFFPQNLFPDSLTLNCWKLQWDYYFFSEKHAFSYCVRNLIGTCLLMVLRSTAHLTVPIYQFQLTECIIIFYCTHCNKNPTRYVFFGQLYPRVT